MKRRLKFRAAAQRDFIHIAVRSEREWGKAHTRRYLDQVEKRIADMVENPMLGHDAGLPQAELRRISAGRDVIFFMFDDEEVTVVRILHDRMDFRTRLK